MSAPPQGMVWRRFRVALHRMMVNTARKRVLMAIIVTEHLLVGLLYGASYVNQPEDDDTKAYDGYVDLTACLFFTYVCAAVSSGAKAIPDFFAIKAVCARERQAGAISPLEHWLASGLATLCTGLTYALCLLVPVYTIAASAPTLALPGGLYAVLIAGANTTALVILRARARAARRSCCTPSSSCSRSTRRAGDQARAPPDSPWHWYTCTSRPPWRSTLMLAQFGHGYGDLSREDCLSSFDFDRAHLHEAILHHDRVPLRAAACSPSSRATARRRVARRAKATPPSRRPTRARSTRALRPPTAARRAPRAPR